MDTARIARERKEREPETAPRSRPVKKSMTVDRTDYMNMLQALYDARELSRELWWVIRAFEKTCLSCKGCIDAGGIIAGMREQHEAIGHILQRGLKGKSYRRIV
jgi:hypothetical protein